MLEHFYNLFQELDGFDTNSTVLTLAATNRPDVLDSALRRPGILLAIIYITEDNQLFNIKFRVQQ